jgi:transcriptional regulator with XRE-family HTH domain
LFLVRNSIAIINTAVNGVCVNNGIVNSNNSVYTEGYTYKGEGVMRMASQGHQRGKPAESGNLASLLRSVRGDRTVREVAKAAGIPASVWSKTENDQQLPSLTTLIRLSNYTKLSLTELSEKAGVPLEASANRRARAARIAAMEKEVPETGILVSILPEMTAEEIGALLTLASRLIAERRQP